MYYIFGEDLAPGLVGPFDTKEGAESHIEFQRQRGDASVCVHDNVVIVTMEEIEQDLAMRWCLGNNLSTAEQDKE